MLKRNVTFSKMNSSTFALGYVKWIHILAHMNTHTRTLLDLIDIVLRYFVSVVSLSCLYFFVLYPVSFLFLSFLFVSRLLLSVKWILCTLWLVKWHIGSLWYVNWYSIDVTRYSLCLRYFYSYQCVYICFIVYFTMQLTCFHYCIYLRQ